MPVACALVCGLFCTLAVWRFLGAGRDDVFLSLWSGETLGDRHWFINYDHQYAEISSSVLHALIIRLLHFLAPGSVFLLNKMVGLLCAMATIALLFRAHDTVAFAQARQAGALVTGFLTATSPFFAYWALGGLETSIHAFLLLSYVMAINRLHLRPSTARALCVGAVASFLVTVRPEGFYVVLLTALLAWWSGRSTKRLVLLAAGMPFVCFVGLACTRHFFTGLFFPNPVYAKVGDLRATIPQGAQYLSLYWSRGVIGSLQFFAVVAAVVLLIRACVSKAGREPFPLIVVASLVMINDGFALLAGGDWMEYFRFLAPAIPLKNLLLVQLIFSRSFVHAGRQRVDHTAAIIGGVLTLAVGIQQQWISGLNPLWAAADNCSSPVSLDLWRGGLGELSRRVMLLNCAHRRDVLAIEPFIEQRMRRYLENAGHLTIMTYQMGFFPYAVRRQFPDAHVSFVDTTGLSDPAVACLPLAKSFIGLVCYKDIDAILRGERDGLSEYVARRRPNMIYLLGADEPTRAALTQFGFTPVWDQQGAVVFWRAE